jgi:mannose-6-phosphate isomerase-like protein (cupin superfamily)
VVLAGTADVRISGRFEQATVGDAIVIPAGVSFELVNRGDRPLQLICCLPVGGEARLADGSTFTPPWAE